MTNENDAPGRLWRRRESGGGDSCDAACARLAEALGCPRAIAELLAGRGIRSAAEAEAFLNPRLAKLLGPECDPMRMRGMPEAVARILTAVEGGEPILIYGDYDVDGTTATVLLKTAIERIGLAMLPAKPAQVSYHVPHRIREGYGMQNNVLGLAAREGIRLVISVDTGIRAFAAADEARALGLDLIVTDHHLPDDLRIPEALAVINPAQSNCEYPSKHLCGAAVAFKLAHALLGAAAGRTADAVKFAERTEKVLLPSFLKLVAIATIADSVPLTGENRAIAALGLAALANPVQPGLRALLQVAKIPLDRAPTATEVGFRIAPRINAAGRMDVAGDVVELFLTRDAGRAQLLAEKLDSLNQDRRDTEAKALEAIERELLTLIEGDGIYPAECILLDDVAWHRGVLGILASRVVERTGRPAIVMTHADGQAHGSGRSIDGFHLLDAIIAAEEYEPGCPLFNRFGGHAHAVGFSLPSERLPELRARMKAHAAEFLTASTLVPVLAYDAEIGVSEVTPELQTWIKRCEPFGMGNPEPVFLTRGATLAAPVRWIKEKHICLQVRGGAGNGTTLSALGWSRPAMDWGRRCEELKLDEGSQVDLLFRLKENMNEMYGGLELELCDVRLAGSLRCGEEGGRA